MESTLAICEGKFCSGKILPLSRFGKRRTSKLGRFKRCKMCCAQTKNDKFIYGICLFCNREHDSLFGTGLYCDKKCCSFHKNNSDPLAYLDTLEKSKNVIHIDEDLTLTKICCRNDCVLVGIKQLITNFYPKNIGPTTKHPGRHSECIECNKQDRFRERSTLSGFINCSVTGCRTRANRNNMEFNIDTEYIIYLFRKQSGRCNVSGMNLTYITGKDEKLTTSKNPFNLSIDRIDNDKGYITTNVQLVCVWIQLAKNDWNGIDFKKWITTAAQNITDLPKNKNEEPYLKKNKVDNS